MHFVKTICSGLQTLCVVVSALVDTTTKYGHQLDKIPSRCVPYVRYFINSSNPSREMAQTEQESGCNPMAESPFAKGLRQFTDRTGEWMSITHCKHLGDYAPFNERWSIECGLIYMQVLEANNDFGDYCFNRTVAEAEYNGGAWVIWELKAVDNSSLDDAQQICGKIKLHNGRKRAGWACKENYEYPEHITRRQPNYLSLGGRVCN